MRKWLKNLTSKKKQVCVIGLDGTPFSLLEDFANKGFMPNLAEAFSAGAMMPMTTALPDISSVAWTSFMTGKNPAKHGIYGFTDLKPNSYDLYFPNTGNVKSEFIWDILERYERRTVAINIPSTYPAMPLNGSLISGFVALDLDKATYPQSLATDLKKIGYRIDVDLEKARVSQDALLAEISSVLDTREPTILESLEKQDWDLFIGVITETDRLHHFLWHALDENESRDRHAFTKVYRRIDKFIGRVIERLNENVLFIILSDHGFCRVKKQIYLNHWLQSEGFLRYKTDSPRATTDIDGINTRAFCMDPGRIYLNVKGRFPQGSVDKKDYEALRTEIVQSLEKLHYGTDNDVVIDKILTREEIYTGPYFAQAPDLIALPRPGWDIKGSFAKRVLGDEGPWTGMHTHNDAVICVNRKIEATNAQIYDAAPTILTYLGIPLPDGLDGKSLI